MGPIVEACHVAGTDGATRLGLVQRNLVGFDHQRVLGSVLLILGARRVFKREAGHLPTVMDSIFFGRARTVYLGCAASSLLE